MFARALPRFLGACEAALRLHRQSGFAWLEGDRAVRDGRYSFIGCAPVEWVRDRSLAALDTLDVGDDAAAVCAGAPSLGRVPRWIGYINYDGSVCFARYDALLAIDDRDGQAFVVADDEASADRLLRCLSAEAAPARASVGAVEVTPAVDHELAIRQALEHIAAGDIYQVNLARRWTASYRGDPLALWLAMRTGGAVPLAFYFDDGKQAILSRTMERFLLWDRAGGALSTRPIKGTIARRRDDAAALRADPKEQAEHTMIVDLMRNDLGRVAEVGSVRLEQMMDGGALRAPGSSGVDGRLSSRRWHDVAPDSRGDVFHRAASTGTPKLRAIQIIEALEPVSRGVYTGALGFVDRSGGLSLAVAIRTAVVEQGRVDYWAGGGLVEASDVQREIAETELKARGFLEAVASLPTHRLAPATLSPGPELR